MAYIHMAMNITRECFSIVGDLIDNSTLIEQAIKRLYIDKLYMYTELLVTLL